MHTILSKVADSILDLLFPLTCGVCGREGHVLCPGCEAAAPRLERPYCPTCAAPGPTGLCEQCAAVRLAIDGIRAPYLMERVIRELVYSLKYRHVRAVAPELARLLATYLESNTIPGQVIVPVPLHARRLRERGYNQSELLARELSKWSGIPIETRALRRTRNTPPQVDMESHDERKRNTEGAFECVSEMEGVSVLLIDDVVTTGSTMSACAAALKTAGAGSVWGLAPARQA